MPDAPTVIDNPVQSRFEMRVDGKIAFVAYRKNGAVMTLLHAEVPPELEGRGLGSKLVRGTLDAVRTQGLKVIPRCPFIAAFIRKNVEYSAMMAEN